MGCPCEGWVPAPGWLKAPRCWWVQSHGSQGCATCEPGAKPGATGGPSPADVGGGALLDLAGQPDLGMLWVQEESWDVAGTRTPL